MIVPRSNGPVPMYAVSWRVRRRYGHSGGVDAQVAAYLRSVSSPTRRRDAETLLRLMTSLTGEEPRMWATVVGFGRYHYRYPSGRESDGPAASFAARREATAIYVPDGVGARRELLEKLGPHNRYRLHLHQGPAADRSGPPRGD